MRLLSIAIRNVRTQDFNIRNIYGIYEHNSYYDYMCITEHNSYASIKFFLTNTIHMRLLSEHIYNLIIEYYFMC